MEEKKSKGDCLAMTTPLVSDEQENQNFIEGNLYEYNRDDVIVYLGKEECNFMDHEKYVEVICDDSQILEHELPFIKKSECHVFQDVWKDGMLGYKKNSFIRY